MDKLCTSCQSTICDNIERELKGLMGSQSCSFCCSCNIKYQKCTPTKLHWIVSKYNHFRSSLFSFLCFHCSAAGGEIFNQCVADNDEAFTEKDVIRLAKQILTGVAFLHRNNVVHLDLKVRTRRDYVTIGNRFSGLERSTEITVVLCNRSSFCTFWPIFHGDSINK